MATSCQYEFQRKLFGFSDSNPETFYTSQWFQCRIAFLCYRIFMFLYSLIWTTNTTIYYVPKFPNYYGFLSNWAEWSLVAYFGVSLGVAMYGVITRNSDREKSEGSRVTKFFKDRLQWFHRLSWVFFNAVISANILVTIMYWSFLSHKGNNAEAANIHQHAMNTVLMLIDLFIIAIPIRLLHFIYPMLYAIVYIIFTLILHGAGVMSVYYSDLLDWQSLPGLSTGLCVGMAVVAIPIVHCAVFGLYHLRAFIARKVLPHDSAQPDDDGQQNPTFQMT